MAIIRKGTRYLVEEILPLIIEKVGEPIRKEIDGNVVCVNSEKLITFKQKGTCCVSCGLVGDYFIKEKHITKRGSEYFHLNLYGVNAQGEEIMLTKDHIMPRSAGGLDDLTNYQTMCEVCNVKKANTINEQVRKEKEKALQALKQKPTGNFALAAAFQKALKKD